MIRALLVAIAVVLSGPAMAQQQPAPFDQAIMQQLGELTFAKIGLMTEVKRLSEENARLKAENDELKRKTAK